ncbi:DUF2238 domain-containing protein [Desulfobaculum bizertense]|uniref:Putative membrane protein n=1 Tax=Desulfobaculum bizertense DSM 18034 TaxID=1121442 RepID=A0A1T4VDZ8_9BACT|nr:DUF2238 domain-containing protein [Desulfobaculum bizertense]UIJ37631.1 DUF2238 domain-containing protein [Desulfobaculum bizertense]SKA63126.1 putative membrane protein [Desulfobaculum bizertense DSM 18034]
MRRKKQRLPGFLATVFVPFWVYMAINPFARDVWWAENIPIMAVFLLLVLTYRSFRFSSLAYAFMAFWLFWHTIGGHYTFANVPFDAFTDFFGFERNHFDRIGHFSVGFYAFPIAELLLRKRWCGPVLACFFALFSIMSIAAGYEIIEWIYAVSDGGEAGVEFLGAQGDIWDAQKDMLADTLGAVFSLAVFYVLGRHRVHRSSLLD